MAITIHAPHLPHLDEWTRRRTMLMTGLVATALAVATVFVIQQAADDATSSSAATTARSTASIAAPTKQALAPATGIETAGAAVLAAPTELAHATNQGPGSNSMGAVPWSADQIVPDYMAAFGTDNPAFVGAAAIPAPNKQALAPTITAPAATGEYMAAYGTDNPAFVGAASGASSAAIVAAGSSLHYEAGYERHASRAATTAEPMSHLASVEQSITPAHR